MNESIDSREALDKDWKEAIKVGVETCLDNAYLAFEETDDIPIAPLDFSPLMITEGMDERLIDELGEHEKTFIQNEIFSLLDFQEIDEDRVGEYLFIAPDGGEWEGEANVSIYKTSRSEEGLYIHKVKYGDEREEFVVAPEEYRF